jgi:hypothetical protein
LTSDNYVDINVKVKDAGDVSMQAMLAHIVAGNGGVE